MISVGTLLFRHVGVTSHSLLPKKSKLTFKHARRSNFIIASALCGLLIVAFRLVSVFNSGHPLTLPSVVQRNPVSSSVSENLPSQNNSLFTTKPTWSQNFAYQKKGQLNSRFWNILEGPAENSNNEQQYYSSSSSNLTIENGVLRLIATNQPQPEGYKYGSARIETQDKQQFLYGRLDITAKLPSGVGTWPAVWLLPANDTYAKKSSGNNILRYKNGGEMDIVEAVGFQPDIIYGVAHTASDITDHADGTGSYNKVNLPNSSSSFNKYTLLWTPNSITFAVNDKPYYTYNRQNGADYTTWPFDQPFYLIANLALGGSWGGLDTAHFPGNGIDNNALPTSLDIRSIYYYPYMDPSIKR